MKYQGKIDGISNDKEFISGWALVDSKTTNLWLNSTANNMEPFLFKSDLFRDDIERSGNNPYCGFQLYFDLLPQSITVIKNELYISFDKDGKLPISEINFRFCIPPIILFEKELIGINQININDIVPPNIKKSIKKLRKSALYYRDWFYLKNYHTESLGYNNEISVFISSDIFSFNLNPFENIKDYSWIKDLWNNHESDIPKYKKPTKNQILNFNNKIFSNGRPIVPEEIEPIFRQFMIDTVRKRKPKISVIIPNWNRDISVLRAIDSALNQTIEPYEIILCDDGSTDNSIKNINNRFKIAIEEKKLKIINQDHSGVSSARNKAILNANGEWFAYLDSDNYWHTDHLLINFYGLFINPNKFKISYSGLLLFGSRVYSKRVKIENFNFDKLLVTNFIDINCLINHKSLFKEYGGFDINLERFVDWDLIIRYTKNDRGSNILRINVSTVKYFRNRKIFKNISNTIETEKAIKKIRKKIYSHYSR